MATPIDFEALSVEELDELSGFQREAWYAHRKGDDEKVAEIFAAYDDPSDEPVADVEPEPDVETPEKTPAEVQKAKRAAAAAAKKQAG